MGHAAAVSRTSVLETAAATLGAVDDVRSLANTIAVEQVALKARIDALEQANRELGAALELNLAAIRAKADMSAVAAQVEELDTTTATVIAGLMERLERQDDILGDSFFGRLRWLVAGR